LYTPALDIKAATELLKKFEKVIDVTVRVQKPHVAVTGTVGSLGIEVFRQRE
jgi:dihydroneopterin aldolase